MKRVWTLARKELSVAFDNVTAYVILTIFLLITGWFFSSTLFLQNVASLRTLFDLIPVLFLFFIPALTMGTFAEERRAGTIELLLTLPVRDWEVIAGKWLGAFLLLVIGIGLTLIYAITLAILGNPDTGALTGGYLGILFLGASSISIGVFASSLTRNQMVAFVLGFAFIFILTLVDKIAVFFPTWLSGILQYLSLDFHYQNMLRGVIDTRDILYFLSVIGCSGLLTAQYLAKRPD